MTNKMAVRVLSYKLGLWGYGDSKLAKWKIAMKKTGSCCSSLVYDERIFWMQLKIVPFLAGTNSE